MNNPVDFEHVCLRFDNFFVLPHKDRKVFSAFSITTTGGNTTANCCDCSSFFSQLSKEKAIAFLIDKDCNEDDVISAFSQFE